jgi:predicted regulator of Ras-like GTPase activity (Roadblock/LC7/MglB family)
MHVDSTGAVIELEVENDGLRHRVAAVSATLTSFAATAA